MKKLILFELILLFLATTFMTDSLPPGWYQQTLPVNDQINDIFFLDSLTGWVVTDGRTSINDTGYIMKTVTGGSNWVVQYNQPMKLNAVQFMDANTGYVAGGSGSGTGRIFKTTNGGTNWINISSFSTQFDDLFFVNKDTGWVADPYGFGGLYKTLNGGLNWQIQLGESYSPKTLFFLNKDTGWVISDEANSKLYMTINGGNNWNLRFTFNTNPVSLYFINGIYGWIGGAGTGNGIQYTTNGGSNWINSQGYAGGGYDIKFVNDSIGFTGRVPQILKSTDGGKNWGFQQMSSNTYRSVSVLRNDTLLAWTGTYSLMHTADGGGAINFLGIKKISNEIPTDFKLYQNYPNPFNPVTSFKLRVSSSSNVQVNVYDLKGKLITTLVNQQMQAGEYLISFDGTNYSSGIYFYTLIADGKVIDTKKMILIK